MGKDISSTQQLFHDLWVGNSPTLSFLEYIREGDAKSAFNYGAAFGLTGGATMNPWTYRTNALGLREWIYNYLATSPPLLDSPTYTWDTPINLQADGRAMPVIFGIVDTSGLKLYEAADSDTRDLFVAQSEGPIHSIRRIKANGVDPEYLSRPDDTDPTKTITAAIQTYLGEPGQPADPRSQTWRHAETPGIPAWNYKTSDTTPAVCQFEVLEDAAHVVLKLAALFTLNGPDSKNIRFHIDYKPVNQTDWIPAGDYQVNFGKNQQGMEDFTIPLYSPGATHRRPHTFSYAYNELTRSCSVSARSNNPGYRQTTDVLFDTLAPGLYLLRLSYDQASYDADEASQIVDSSLVVGSSRVDLQACKLEYSIVSPK